MDMFFSANHLASNILTQQKQTIICNTSIP